MVATVDPRINPSEASRIIDPTDRVAVQQGLQGVHPDYQSQLQALQSEIELSQKQGDAMRAELASQATATDLKYRKDREELLRNAPKAPTTPFVPHPKELSEFGGLLMVMGALAGRSTLQPMTAALNNLTAIMRGHQEGNHELVAMQKEAFDANFKAGLEKYKEYKDEIKALDTQYGYDLKSRQDAERQINLRYGISKDLMQLQEKGVSTLVHHEENVAKLEEKEREFSRKMNPMEEREISPEMVSADAAQLRAGVPLNVISKGWGKAATAYANRVKAEAVRQLISEGHSTHEAGNMIAQAGIGYAAGKRTLTQLTLLRGTLLPAIEQLDYNSSKAMEEMAKLGSTNLSPILNAIARGEEKWTGDPAYTSLAFYMNATLVEAARIMSGGQASVAQLHASAMEKASEWANMNITPAAFNSLVNSLRGEGRNRLENYDHAIEFERRRIGGVASPIPPRGAEPIAGGKGNVSNATLNDYAAKHKMTIDAARDFLKAQGYAVQ